MRIPIAVLLAALSLIPATSARAQYGHGDYGGDRRPRRDAPVDSTRTLAGAFQVWGHAGVDWLGQPADVRSRYNAGFGVGLSADRRLRDRFALRARVDYHDLPSTQPTFLVLTSSQFVSAVDYGHGWMTSGLAGVALRTWDHLWLEGEGGGGYFDSGFSKETVTDPITGAVSALTGRSGWGGAWSAGARYEFQPWRRDRLLAELQVLSLRRGEVTLTAWALRVGTRFH